MQKLSHQTLCFDGFTLDLTRGCLLRGAQEVKLRPKPFDALKYLVENPGRLISKAELIQVLWPDTAVTDDSLVQCLIEVRRALHDEAQQIIKTVPRRGYIFERAVCDGASIVPLTTVTQESGVHLVIEEEETNGHGVIAAQSLPVAGRVALPAEYKGTVIQRIRTAIGQHKLTTAIGAMIVVLAAGGVFYFTRPGEAIDSVAVMPFVNVSGDPNTEYLSDGLSESIINRLSELPNLKNVIAFNSVLRYKGKQTDPKTVGRELGVRAVLMSRLVQRGDDLEISVELIDVGDDRHLWGEQYNRKLSEIALLPPEIAQEISEKLRLRLSGEEKKRLTKRYTESGEAYGLYLMGNYFLHRRTKEGMSKSIEFFDQAIKKDQSYAPAYAGLAFAYGSMGFQGMLAPDEARQKQELAARKALEIDNDLAEAHSAMAFVRSEDLNWSASGEEHKLALKLNPNSAYDHQNYAYHLEWLGRVDEAIQHLKRAQELDPLSLIIGSEVGSGLYYARQYDQAIEQFQKIIEMDPGFAPAHIRLANAYQAKGMYEEAIPEYKKGIALDKISRRTAQLGYAYATAGKRDEAQKILDELRERPKEQYVSPFDIALIYIGLGDSNEAFVYLEKAYDERPDSLNYIKVDPRFDSLRSDPRFDALLRRMRLAP